MSICNVSFVSGERCYLNSVLVRMTNAHPTDFFRCFVIRTFLGASWPSFSVDLDLVGIQKALLLSASTANAQAS